LPPLKPPSDPAIAQEEEEKRWAVAKQRQDLIRRKEEQQKARLEAIQKYEAERNAGSKQDKTPAFVTEVESVAVVEKLPEEAPIEVPNAVEQVAEQITAEVTNAEEEEKVSEGLQVENEN
jgi:hypothetical protein